jgi:hypothetical protein
MDSASLDYVIGYEVSETLKLGAVKPRGCTANIPDARNGIGRAALMLLTVPLPRLPGTLSLLLALGVRGF